MAFDENAPLLDRLREGDDLASRIEAANEIADLRAANDAAEKNVGYGNGDLWRFWRDKALKTAAENTRLRSEPMTPMAAARVLAKRRREYRELREECLAAGATRTAYALDFAANVITITWEDLKEASEEAE